MGVFFCKKKWTFPQRRVHYVQYQYFLFYLFGGSAYTPNTLAPAYRPGSVQSVFLAHVTHYVV